MQNTNNFIHVFCIRQKTKLIYRLSLGAAAFVRVFRSAFVETRFTHPIMMLRFTEDSSKKDLLELSKTVHGFFTLMSQMLETPG